MKTNELLFGGAALSSSTADAGRLVLRLTLGLALAIAHGFGKVPPSEGFIGMIGGMGFPAPGLFAWLVAFTESIGGLLLAAGLLTRPASLLIVVNFLVIFFVALAGQSFSDRELELLFLAGAFFFMLAGAGRYSVDSVIRGRGAAPLT